MLPNFIHAGVPKAASATLEIIFEIHPDIYTTRAKEIDFFSNAANYEKGVDWYEETFFKNTGNAPIVCDRSIGYSTGLALDAPQRIFESLGRKVKLLFVLRHPVDRAYSQYCMAHYKAQLDRLSFDESVEEAMSIQNEITRDDIWRVQSGSYYSNNRDLNIFRFCVYLKTGLYARTLENYLEFFESDRILILFVDDIERNLQTESDKIFKFLGVKRIDVSGINRRNESQKLRYPAVKRVANSFYRSSYIRNFLNSVVSGKVRGHLKRLLLSKNYRKNIRLPAPNLATQIRLQKFYIEDMQKTQLITGRNLTDWLEKYPVR